MRTLAHSASLLMLAGFAAQALQFLGTIFLARIYSPDAYGNLTLVVNWASVFAATCSLQLHIALHVAQPNAKAREIMGAALVTVPTVAASLGVLAYLLDQPMFISAAIVGAALAFSNVGRAALARNSANALIAGLTVGRAVVVIAAQFGFRFFGQGGLIMGLLLAEVFAAIAFLSLSVGKRCEPKFARTAKVILENRNFTAWGVAQELVAIGVVFMPFLLCSLIYDAGVVGHYGVAYRLLWAPAVVLSFGFGLAFLTELSRRPERFREILVEVHFVWLAFLIMIVAFSSAFWMPQLFLLILGNDWAISANMSPAVTVAAASFLVSSPFRQLYRVRQKQPLQLCIDLGTIALISLVWLVPPSDPVRWVYTICGIVVLQNFLMIAFSRRFQLW